MCVFSRKHRFLLFIGALVFVIASALAYAQGPSEGIPPFSTIENHGTDAINLENLSVLLNVPVRTKAGAIPFNYSLIGDQTCFIDAVIICGISSAKTNSTNASYIGDKLSGVVGSATYLSTSSIKCDVNGQQETTTEYAEWVIIDGNGTLHHLTNSASDYVDSLHCLKTSFTDYAADGSGFSISVNEYAVATVYDAYGNSTVAGVGVTDTNGNALQRTVSNGANVYTDTLNTTALTATPESGNTAGSYKWTDVNDGSQSVTETLTSESVYSPPGCSMSGGPWTASLLTQLNFPDGSNVQLGYEPVSGGGYTGRLQTIKLRTGGTITYQYSGGTNGIDCTYLVPPVVKRTTQDGTWTYTWALLNNGSGNYGNTTTVIDPGGNKKVYTFTGLTSVGFGSTTPLTEVQVYQNTGTVSSPAYSLLSTDVICYNGNSSNCSTTVVQYPITERDVYHTIAGMSSSAHTMETYDGYGNLTKSIHYDFGSTTVYDETQTTYGSWNGSSCVAIGSYIYAKPCDVLTVENGSTVAESRFSYDSHGNLLTTYRWTGTSWLSNATANSYNSNGTPATLYDIANIPTTYSYDGTGGCNSVLPTSVSSAGLTRYYTWYCGGAVPETVSIPNTTTVVTTYGYTNSSDIADPFWRLSYTTDPLGNTTWSAYTPNSENDALSFGSSINSTTGTVDGYGRLVNTQTNQSPSGTNYDTVSNSYGWSGTYSVKGTSQPCSEPSGSDCSIVHNSYYDPLGRLYQATTTSNETLTHTYTQNDDLRVLTPAPSGENSKQLQTQYDALGRLTSSCSISSTATGNVSCGQNTNASTTGILTTTSYTFASGSQTVSSTRGSQTRSQTVDGMGRVTQVVTPEGGTVSYVYDTESSCGPNGAYARGGDLLQTVDAAGRQICYYYDGLHRLTDVGNNAQSSTNVCKRFRFDSSSNAYRTAPSSYPSEPYVAGKLMEAETDDCSGTVGNLLTDEWFAYDADGRMTDMWEMTPDSGGYYHTTVAYAANGAVTSLSGIPGYAAYAYTLDGEGRPNAISQSGSYGAAFVTAVTYNASSDPTKITYDNTDTDTYTYDPNTGRMTNYTFNVASTSDSGTLHWNPNGTLYQLVIADDVQLATDSQTCTYGYDDLLRLGSDNCGSQWSQSFSYDQYENVSKTGNPGTTWQPGYNPANNQYSTIGATYDANGDLTYDSFNTYTWNVHGKVASVQSGKSAAVCGSSGTCVTYDAMGRAVERNNGGVFSEILYSPTGETAIMSGASTVTVSYIPQPGGGYMWVNTAGGANQVTEHRDWLGSVRLEINPGGGVDTTRSVHAYAPFGETYDVYTNCCGTVNFTGDRQDLFAGLFDTPNRELNPIEGRWLSPDPIGAGWNRYAYATNPNSSTDQSGLILDWPAPSGWFGTGGGCTVDGVDSRCGVLGSNGMAACPNNACTISLWVNGSGNDGGHWTDKQFWAFANGGTGYYASYGPGAVYYSAQQAGKAGALFDWQTSNSQLTEYGGNIYEDTNEIYSFSDPQKSSSPCDLTIEQCESHIDTTNIPAGSALVGTYHTHPNIPGGGDFSLLDTETDLNGPNGSPLLGFVSTAPSGRVLMFDPNRYTPWANGVPNAAPPVCVLSGASMGVRPCQ